MVLVVVERYVAIEMVVIFGRSFCHVANVIVAHRRRLKTLNHDAVAEEEVSCLDMIQRPRRKKIAVLSFTRPVSEP